MTSVDFVVPGASPKPAPGLRLRWSVALLAVTLTLLAIRLFAFEAVIGLAVRLISSDGQISAQNRQLLGNLLVEIIVWIAALNLCAFVMSTRQGAARARALLRSDRLESPLSRVPDPYRVLLVSSVLGIAVIGLWLLRPRLPTGFEWVFAKEGALEFLTFALLIVSAGLCAGAARRRYVHRTGAAHRWIVLSYAAMAVVLFATGMEEISWGQTYLAWETPEKWAAINSQQETTLHNLLDQRTLHIVAQRITYAFAALMLLATFIGIRVRHPYISAMAPHFSTIVIVLLIAYSALRFHLEVSEILLSIFATCYSWRGYIAAAISRDAVNTSVRTIPTVQ